MGQQSVLLTGSEGVVGRILAGRAGSQTDSPRLQGSITGVDRVPDAGASGLNEWSNAHYRDRLSRYHRVDFEVANNTVGHLMAKHKTLIHAAWSSETVLRPGYRNPNNVRIVREILDVVARLSQVNRPKIVLFSSVNVNVPVDWIDRRARKNLISAYETPVQPRHHNRGGYPSGGTGYGLSKVEMEAVAREYAVREELDVTVIRLGGVNLKDQRPSEHDRYLGIAASPLGRYFDLRWEDAVHLRHADLISAVQSIVDRDTRYGAFSIFNLVSASSPRVHMLFDGVREY
jgi:nucleoside-diphosphate-sugar epimerase